MLTYFGEAQRSRDIGSEPATPLLHDLFTAQAAARPGQLALVCGAEEMTYDELDRASNRLARLLRGWGVARGGLVGLLLPRSTDVYVAMLAVLKAGAAYVPLDPDYPAERVGYILDDCGVHTLITTSALADKAQGYTGPRLLLDVPSVELEQQSTRPLAPDPVGVSGEDLCYIIYTSGSTGRPKGVQVEHAGVCNFVRAEGDVFQLQPSDRVFQGFSVAFDASLEEIWLAFFAGATLVVGTADMVHAGPALAGMLTQARVSVLSCVPTMLSMLDEDLPTVRILIVGGEACPQDLVRRWCRPGRRMVNTYGPTEATVAATFAELTPDRPVTIGKPFSGCFACILDDSAHPAPVGMAGELCLGGIGLARGYVGRDDLTGEKFIDLAGLGGEDYPARWYKTGDLARWNTDGDIEFLGRIDTQVKIRGYRVELSEIEAVLLQCPGVRSAAVVLRKDQGIEQLVGYVVAQAGSELAEDKLRGELRLHLPAYMVPALIESVASLPTMPSGKVDRNALPPPRLRAEAGSLDLSTRTDTERQLARVWQQLFVPSPVSWRDHFFLDLGGHSLLAARMVSELRKQPALQHLSMLDIYHHPTIETLAAHLDANRPSCTQASSGTPLVVRVEKTSKKPSSLRYSLCGLAQFFALYFIVGFYSLQWVAPFLTYTFLRQAEVDVLQSLGMSLVSLLGLYPIMLTLAVVAKWTIIGRFKPGRYRLWGFYYFRWWFVKNLMSIIPAGYLCGTPLLAIYYRLLGARIGSNVHLGSDEVFSFDLLTIGADTSIGTECSLLGFTVEDGYLTVGTVTVGSRCFIGTRCIIQQNASMADDSKLEDLTLLRSGSHVPSGEHWVGSPGQPDARKMSLAAPRLVERPSLGRRIGYAFLHVLGLQLLQILVISAIFPGMMLMGYLNDLDEEYYYLALAPAVAFSFVVLLCLEIAVIKWLVLGRVRPARYPLHSFYYFRKWFVDQTLELSLDVLGPLYATLYLAPWYRLLGAKVGKRAEISTASFISPDLLSIDDESFVADSVSLGAGRVEDGWVTIAGNKIGKNSFIGNSAHLPPGSVIGNNCLIGCYSIPPEEAKIGVPDGTDWLGSPSFFLPQRQESTAFPDHTTTKPTLWLYLQRGLIEFFRIILPSTGFIVLTSLLFSTILLLRGLPIDPGSESPAAGVLLGGIPYVFQIGSDSPATGGILGGIPFAVHLGTDDTDTGGLPFWQILLLFPVLCAGCGVLACACTILCKWLLMGRYRSCEKPLWSRFVWRNELVTTLREHLADLFLVNMLTGTPFICWFFRLLGTKIGKRVYMDTTDLTEFDLVTVGDDVALNSDCTLQTHLFEDRVMKMSHIQIGAHSSVGSLAVVLYDTQMEDGVVMEELSLLMKGESLPARTRWAGIPATRMATL